MAHRGFFHDTQWTMSTQKPPPTLTNSRLLSAIYSKKVKYQYPVPIQQHEKISKKEVKNRNNTGAFSMTLNGPCQHKSHHQCSQTPDFLAPSIQKWSIFSSLMDSIFYHLILPKGAFRNYVCCFLHFLTSFLWHSMDDIPIFWDENYVNKLLIGQNRFFLSLPIKKIK